MKNFSIKKLKPLKQNYTPKMFQTKLIPKILLFRLHLISHHQ